MGYGYGFNYTRQKKHRERRKFKRTYPAQRFIRVNAQVKIESTGEVFNGRALLHDLTPGGIGLFVEAQLIRGEKISIVIEHPKHLFVKGEVAWCTLCPVDSKVIHVESFRYRVGIKFHFETQSEAQTVGDYCSSMAVTLETA